MDKYRTRAQDEQRIIWRSLHSHSRSHSVDLAWPTTMHLSIFLLLILISNAGSVHPTSISELTVSKFHTLLKMSQIHSDIVIFSNNLTTNVELVDFLIESFGITRACQLAIVKTELGLQSIIEMEEFKKESSKKFFSLAIIVLSKLKVGRALISVRENC